MLFHFFTQAKPERFYISYSACVNIFVWLIKTEACFFSFSVSEEAMPCLSRSYQDRNIFEFHKTRLHEKKRWNFYSLIDIEDGMLKCQNAKYPIQEICLLNREGHSSALTIPSYFKCTFKNGETEFLDPEKLDLCFDYSFWQKTSNRCAPKAVLKNVSNCFTVGQANHTGCPGSIFHFLRAIFW